MPHFSVIATDGGLTARRSGDDVMSQPGVARLLIPCHFPEATTRL